MERAIFIILAIVAVTAAVGVIAQRSAVRSALFLLVHFCCLAGLYILLHAQFLAVVQIIIYAGAVVVLFLFVVMLLGAESTPGEETRDRRRQAEFAYERIGAVLLAALLLAGMAWVLIQGTAQAFPGLTHGEPSGISGGVREIGAALLTRYAVPFELVSLVLLVAIIGAVALARRVLGPASGRLEE
jgi:NADH-quinone oxidoreductase subunit J